MSIYDQCKCFYINTLKATGISTGCLRQCDELTVCLCVLVGGGVGGPQRKARKGPVSLTAGSVLIAGGRDNTGNPYQ